MNSDNDIYSQKEFWLGRLGGIIITKFRQLSIAEVDCINCTISLWESGYSAIVQICEDGYLKWDKFDDTDIGRSKIAYESGENFYKPFIKKIEQIYYSSEYEGITESEQFMARLEKGKFSARYLLVQDFIELLIWIAAIIGLCVLIRI